MPDLVVRALRENEREHAADLVASTFSRGDTRIYHKMFHWYQDQLPHRPGSSIQQWRGAFLEEKLISFARVDAYHLHYGQARLRVAGISEVCTRDAYQGQGYNQAVIRDILTYSAEQGAHMALLNGIGGYYERFGFIPLWPRYTLQFAAADALRLSSPLRLREAAPDDLSQMAKLYNQHWGGRVTFSRSAALWQWRMAIAPGQAVVTLDGAGVIQGYLWHRPDDYGERIEVVANHPEAIIALMQYSARQIQHAGLEMVTWSVPPDDVIIPYAQQMLATTLSAHYTPSGSWMGRLIDPSALVQALLPEIVSQAKVSMARFDARDLLLKVEPDGVHIGMSRDRDSFCHLSLRDFLQILFGSLRPAMLAVRQPLSRQSLALLENLFPARIAALAAWDWF